MTILATLYSEDDGLLREIAGTLEATSAKAGEPSEVEAPGSLDIDLATIATSLWELLVVFGSVKASLEALQLIMPILRDWRAKGKTTKLEMVGPRNSKITLEGSMTPEEVEEELTRYQAILQEDPES